MSGGGAGATVPGTLPSLPPRVSSRVSVLPAWSHLHGFGAFGPPPGTPFCFLSLTASYTCFKAQVSFMLGILGLIHWTEGAPSSALTRPSAGGCGCVWMPRKEAHGKSLHLSEPQFPSLQSRDDRPVSQEGRQSLKRWLSE